jgi:hypothetical protein
VALDITEGKLFPEGNLGDRQRARRLSMRMIKEVLRLRFELKMGQQEIARACSISQSTVHEYLKAATAAGVSWPLAEGGQESRLEAVLFGKTPRAERKPQHVVPDFRSLQDQLQRHQHLTLQLAWEEYRQANPRAIATAGSANSTNDAVGSKMWFSARSTKPARRGSWTGPERRSQYTHRATSLRDANAPEQILEARVRVKEVEFRRCL